MSTPLRLLLVRLSALGDCLHAVPFIEAVRQQHPDAHIGWLIQGGGRALLSDYCSVDRFHLFERKAKGLAAVQSLRQLRHELRQENYDVVVDLQGLTKSGLLARLAGTRRVVGFAAPESRELNSWFVKERVAVSEQVELVVDRNLALLPSLGFEVPARATWSLPAVDLGGTAIGAQLDAIGVPENRALLAAPRVDQGVGGEAQDVLEGESGHPFEDGDGHHPRLAVLNPGTTWETKIWPQEHFAEVGRLLHRAGFTVMVSWGGDSEEALADRIVVLATEAGTPIAKAAPTDLVELRGLYQRAAVVIANDSGPLHLGVAVGVPTVGVYGPTAPARNGPYGWRDESWPSSAVTVADLGRHQVASADGRTEAEQVGEGALLQCQYCWKTRCARTDNACLTEVGPGLVVERALALLDPTSLL